MIAERRRLDISKVACITQGSLYILCRLDASFAESLGREGHEPIVVHVNGLSNIILPLLRLVEIDGLSGWIFGLDHVVLFLFFSRQCMMV